MTNLIPPTAQTQVTREYWMRTASVGLFLLSFGCVIIIILYIPVYMLVQSQLKTFQNEFKHANSADASFSDAEKALTLANTLSKLLVSSGTTTPFTQVVTQLKKYAGSEISIKDIRFVRTDGVITLIDLNGLAQSRLSLVAFQKKLEADTQFSDAKLPLSNLAKDKDIPFTITIEKEKVVDKTKKP